MAAASREPRRPALRQDPGLHICCQMNRWNLLPRQFVIVRLGLKSRACRYVLLQ